MTLGHVFLSTNYLNTVGEGLSKFRSRQKQIKQKEILLLTNKQSLQKMQCS